MYYKITAGIIDEGPFSLRSSSAKNYTNNGTPWLLTTEKLAEFGIVSESKEPLTAGMTHGTPYVAADGLSVIVPAVAMTADQLASCKFQCLSDIKAARAQGLDKLVASPGIGAVYDRNVEAANLIRDGLGSAVMFSTVTANDIGAEFGANLVPQLTAAEWADYIIDQEQADGSVRGKQIEKYYLHYYYTVANPSENIVIISQAVNDYRSKIDAILTAETIADVLAI